MVLPVIKYGSPLLREKSVDLDGCNIVQDIAIKMTYTLKHMGAIGLAGPQVGLLKNVFIINTSSMKIEGLSLIDKIYINPEILNYSEQGNYYQEACLSIPGIWEELLRPEKIEVRYRNENFDWREEVLQGFPARIFQHEYDHLQGVLFVDKLSSIQRKLLQSRLKALEKMNK